MKRAHWRLLAWGATLTVIALCLWPHDQMPEHEALSLDKLWHAVAFFGIGFLWRLSGMPIRRVLVLGLALSAGTEIAQTLMGQGRVGEVLDFVADMAGLVPGALLAHRIRTYREAPATR